MTFLKALLAILVCCTASTFMTAQTKTPPAPQKRPSLSAIPTSLTATFETLRKIMEGQKSDHEMSNDKGPVMPYNLAISQVVANPSKCSLNWVETMTIGEGRNSQIHSIQVNVRQASHIDYVSFAPPANLTVAPSIWNVRIWMLPGSTASETTVRLNSDGSQYRAPEDTQPSGEGILVATKDDAMRLQSALQNVLTACQQAAPAALSASDSGTLSGPTVQESVAFINGQLASQGKFHFIMHRSGDRQGDIDTVIDSQSFSLTGNCITDFELRGENNFGMSLKTPLEEVDPRSIVVEDYGLHQHKQLLKQEPSPLNITFVTDPPVYVLIHKGFFGYFLDKSIAERVAKAYIHASVLCGAGKDQPF